MTPATVKKIESADQILGQVRLAQEWVDVPEWGGRVLVREMDAESRDAFENSLVKIEGNKTTRDLKNMRAKLAARSIVKEDGTLMFSEEQIAALGKVGARGLDRVVEVARKLSGLSEKDMEELAGN